LSSKLRKLKQQAYEAGRKRDWSTAASAYAEILEADKNNPSLLNEYGDVCLKAGETVKAVRQFLAAASKYRQTGLLNNAQAVYKKVLRHDADNLNANWFLAEIRAAQGLVADGEQHALKFLAAAEEVSGEIKEIFLKRCLEIFEVYPESDVVLERVEGIFRLWDMQLEAARTGCLRACIAHRAGQVDEAAASVAQIVEKTPEISNYAEFTRWQQATGQGTAVPGVHDVNAIDLGGADDPAPAPAPEPAAAAPPAAVPADPPAAAPVETAVETPAEAASAFEEFLDAGGELELNQDGSVFGDGAADGDEPMARDDDGCISIDADDGGDFDSLLADAVAGVNTVGEAAPEPEPRPEPAAGTDEKVNLLDAILAEEGEDILRASDTEQVSTIASEIGRNLGETQEEDPETQYQQGLVYLELGMYDQAALAFSAVADDPAHALQAREMWGLALHREGRLDEALEVLLSSLTPEADGTRAALGLRYQAGRILEELDRADEAQEHYRQVHALDAGFADVAQRLRTPAL
jgi:tetratricopeptide (TPR) repeat protein